MTTDRYAALRDELRAAAFENRIPLEGGIELTSRCNFDCVHCFRPTLTTEELATERFFGIVDELVDAGCLFLTITGGEPLMHPEFLKLHQYIRKAGILTILFTNGALLDEATIEGLLEAPPVVVEISVYGSSKETYGKITGNEDGYVRTMKGINLLLEAGLPVHLKTVIIRQNQHELESFIQTAKSLGVSWDYEMCLNPRIDGNLEPLDYRLAPSEIVEVELADVALRRKWAYALEQLSLSRPVSTLRKVCNAGISVFVIDSAGRLHPCILWRSNPISLRALRFDEAWQGPLSKVSNLRLEMPSECLTCRLEEICTVCPAWSSLEEGNREIPLQFMCDLTRARMDSFGYSSIASSPGKMLPSGGSKSRTGGENGQPDRAERQDEEHYRGRDSDRPQGREPTRRRVPPREWAGTSSPVPTVRPVTENRGVMLQEGHSLQDGGCSSRGVAVSEADRFRRNKDLVLREVAGHFLLIPTGPGTSPMTLLNLGSFSAQVWNALGSGSLKIHETMQALGGDCELGDVANAVESLCSKGAIERT